MNPIYIIIALIVVALIALAVILLIQRNKKKKAAALAAAGEEPLAPGGDEISVLTHDADLKIAAAKIEAGARLGTLPAYLILGDPGSTKTSVMLNSGLDPELIAGQVYQNGNVTSTRTANLWFSRRSVFVEAGGKLLSDPAQWKRLVQRLMPRGSVVGKGEQAPRAAVVCFDCENFTRAGAQEQAVNAARVLRARLGEISQAWGINLPVYALFTKMDRLPFFTEYVRNLTAEEAGQVLGVTLPMMGVRPEGVYADEETARLTGNFERLFRSLADARPEFLSRESDPAKLPAEYEFPREFRKVRAAAVQFMVDLCRPSQLTIGPFLRGFYFSGVRPVVINETAPVQAAAQQQAGYGAASGATGIFSVGARQAAQAAAPQIIGTRKVPQWLFLGQFFTGVLLADTSAMGASGSSTKTSGKKRLLFGAAAALCFLLTLGFTVSFFKNHSLESQVREAAQGLASGESSSGDLAATESLRKLDNLRLLLDRIVTYRREGAPWGYRWFLYTGDDLYPEARTVYFARFKQLLFGQTQSAILLSMKTLPVSPANPPVPEYQPAYDALKAYLITTSYHDKSTRLFLSPVLMNWWANGRTVDPERKQLAQKQFDFYADQLKEDNPFSKDNDAGAIKKSRDYLSQFAGTERVYAFMLAEAGKSNPPIDFNRQFPGSAQVVIDTHPVIGAFSKGGWAFMKDAIQHADRYFNGEQWVLGDQAAATIDRAKLAADLRTRYNSDFTKEWRAYIKSATVVRYAGLKDASQKLTQLSGNQSPLLELFSLASTNTDVDDPAVKGLFQPVQTVVPPGSTDKFIAAPNQNYMGALIALQAALDGISNQPGQPSDVAAAPALTAASQAKTTTKQMAQAFNIDKEGHVDGMTQQLLEDPILFVEPMLRSLAPAELNAKAGKDLCGPMRALMAKYPFSANSRVDATLQDVNSVFKPKEGAIWVFYDANLQKLLQKQGSQFVPVTSGGMSVTSAFLAMMNRAAAFTDVAYASGADPHFTFTIRPTLPADQDSVKFTINGESHDFSAATASQTYSWPGNSSGALVTVKFKDGSSNEFPKYDGLWGIFRFIQDADKHEPTQVEWTAKTGKQNLPLTHAGQPITLRFAIDSKPPVFDKGYFNGMACVTEVAK